MYGNKWSEISKILSGRTENSVKNRFNCLLKKEKEEMMGKNVNGTNLDDALSNAIKNENDDSQWVDSIISKKKLELSMQSGTVTYPPLQEKIKKEIHSYLSSTDAPSENGFLQFTPNSSTCPNFRYLMRRSTLLKDSEKFINPITKQVLYVHPIGVYIDANNSNKVNRILQVHEFQPDSKIKGCDNAADDIGSGAY